MEYEPLGVVADPVYAHTPEAPVLHDHWEGGNLLKHIKVRHGDLEAGFAAADVIVERTYKTATTEHAMIGHMSQPPAWTISSIRRLLPPTESCANYSALRSDSP